VISVAGCVAQQEGEKLLRRMTHVDVILGPDCIAELPALVEHVRDGGPPVVRTVFDLAAPAFLVARPRTSQREVASYVTVMKGCDERCSFCIVPYTRGSERYRGADEIVREISGLAEGGVREITLLGQTVNSWHDPSGSASGGESEFASLLGRIAREVPSLARLRYTSPHPRHVTAALVRAHAELAVLPAHVHLPVQSGSDRVLRRMIRRYTRDEYVQRAEALRHARAGLTLSTDFIVGFPGETEEDFLETLSLVREVGFVAAFAFKYSPRPYTPALKLGDDVPEEVKDERLARLFELVEAQQQAHLDSLVGASDDVLVEGRSLDGSGTFVGRSSRHEIVHVASPDGRDLRGELVRVRIERAYKHSLAAALEGEAAPRPLEAKPRVRLPVAPSAGEP